MKISKDALKMIMIIFIIWIIAFICIIYLFRNPFGLNSFGALNPGTLGDSLNIITSLFTTISVVFAYLAFTQQQKQVVEQQIQINETKTKENKREIIAQLLEMIKEIEDHINEMPKELVEEYGKNGFFGNLYKILKNEFEKINKTPRNLDDIYIQQFLGDDIYTYEGADIFEKTESAKDSISKNMDDCFFGKFTNFLKSRIKSNDVTYEVILLLSNKISDFLIALDDINTQGTLSQSELGPVVRRFNSVVPVKGLIIYCYFQTIDINFENSEKILNQIFDPNRLGNIFPIYTLMGIYQNLFDKNHLNRFLSKELQKARYKLFVMAEDSHYI